MLRATATIALAGVVTLVGCVSAPATSDPGAVRQTVDSMLATHAQVLIREDLDAAMTLYSNDPVIYPNHAEPQRGRDELRRFIAGWFTGLNFTDVKYRNDEVAVFGDTAVVIGSVEATVQPEGAAPMSDRGSYMLLLVKDSTGRWRSHRGVFNSSLPLVPPPAAK